MTNNTKKIAACAAGAVVVLAVGMGAYTNYIVNKTKTEIATEQTAKTDLKNQTLKYLSSEHEPEEIETTLIDAFKQLDEDDNTEILDTLLYGTYNAASQYVLSDDDTNALYHVMSDDGSFDIDALEDSDLKERIEALNKEHVVVKYVNGSMFYDVDYDYFSKTFGDYVNPEYKGMLDFYKDEKSESYFDEANSKLYTDVVEKRLDTLYKMTQEYTNSDILAITEDCYKFYEAVYLGAYSQDYIFENGKIKQEIIDAYEKYKDETEDTDLREFISTLISDYNEVSLDRTTPIYEKIKEFCGLQSENAGGNESEIAEAGELETTKAAETTEAAEE